MQGKLFMDYIKDNLPEYPQRKEVAWVTKTEGELLKIYLSA